MGRATRPSRVVAKPIILPRPRTMGFEKARQERTRFFSTHPTFSLRCLEMHRRPGSKQVKQCRLVGAGRREALFLHVSESTDLFRDGRDADCQMVIGRC